MNLTPLLEQEAIVRLTSREIDAIKQLSNEHFGAGAAVYLFGSRVDDGRRGGDIDLYIETDEGDSARILRSKYEFLADLKQRIGDQRIDVVFSFPSRHPAPAIIEEARRTGVRL